MNKLFHSRKKKEPTIILTKELQSLRDQGSEEPSQPLFIDDQGNSHGMGCVFEDDLLPKEKINSIQFSKEEEN